MPNKKTGYRLLACVIVAGMQSCVGIDHTVFYTKTNRGVDFATTPPTLAIDISREEGIITPQFQNGLVAPVLASFKTDSDKLFAANAGSTFATGDAAMTLATLYDSQADGTVSEGTLRLNALPTRRGSSKVVDFQQNDVRPLIFGTKTSLGMRIGWSNMTSTLPDNFTLGYNRTELAFLPVTMKVVTTGSEYEINQASLLATLDFTLQAPSAAPGVANPDVDTEPDLVYLQYFATGSAASELATHPEVRAAMLSRLDPEQDFQISPMSLPIVTGMLDLLDELARSDPYAQILSDTLDNKSFPIPDSFPSDNLTSYVRTSDAASIQIRNQSRDFNDKDAGDLIALLGELSDAITYTNESIEKVRDAIDTPGTDITFGGYDQPGPRSPNADDLERISVELNALREAYINYYRLFSTDADIQAAYRYISGRIASGG